MGEMSIRKTNCLGFQQWNENLNLAFGLQFVLPVRCAGVMAAQIVWEHWNFCETCVEYVDCFC